MKQVLFTVLIISLIALSKNSLSYAIVGANCPHFNESLNCLEPANWETWIRISVEFEPNSEIEDTNWSIDFSVSDPSQYNKIPKSEFVNYGGGFYLLRNMYRFPIPVDAQSYGFALYLMSENNALLVTKPVPFYICDGNNSYKVSNTNSFNLVEAKNYSDENFDQYSNQNNITFYPNPVISDFTIEYEANQNEDVILKIFDIEGKTVYKTLFKHQNPGRHIKYFNYLNLVKGVYFCNFRIGHTNKTLKLTKL